MRLLIIAPEFPPDIGGMQSHAGQTSLRLAARGHHLVVLTAAKNRSHPGDFPFEVHRALGRSASDARANIQKAFRRLSPDAILLMNSGIAPIVASLRGRRPPLVLRTAGNDAYGAWYGPRHPLRFLFWHLPHMNPRSMGARLRKLDQDHRVRTVLGALSTCDRILCNSSYTISRLLSLGVPESPLRLLSGGVDTELFQPADPITQRERSTQSTAVLGIAGHLLPIKGMDVALRMLSILNSTGRTASLRIAGAGPDEVRLRTIARSCGVEGRVAFLGDLGPKELLRFYHDLDLYLQPSIEIHHDASGIIQAETMGRALCEASACGVPVVASRSGGIPDVVRDGINGRLVPPGDPLALASAVGQMLAAPDVRERLGAAGRRFAVEMLSWNVVIDKTEGHLNEAILEKQSGHGVKTAS